MGLDRVDRFGRRTLQGSPADEIPEKMDMPMSSVGASSGCVLVCHWGGVGWGCWNERRLGVRSSRKSHEKVARGRGTLEP